MKAILLIVWMLFTLILVCSVIGMFLFIPMDHDSQYVSKNPSTWMKIGLRLLEETLKK